ncbi:acyltransferase [Pedobacter sp. GSP4]|uniref:acyltransferase n=1 Tax=Pedobacter sp. GSP4 TaxID=3453716 RepID=UPI003EEEACCF
MDNKQNERVLWADYLRVLGTVSVIFLHIAANTASQYGNISTVFWWVGNVYDSSVRFCVPIFVMLTGALLLNEEVEISGFLRRRVIRVVLPLFFWSLVYILNSLNGVEMSAMALIRNIYTSMARGSAYHLWYVYMIIGIYLFIPIIGKWVRNCSEKEMLYFLCIWLLTLFLNQPFIHKFKINIDLTYFSGYLGYLILGYYLSKKTFKHEIRVKCIAVFLIIIGIGITAVGTYLVSKYKGEMNGAFYSYLTPNVLLIAVGVFVSFKTSNFTGQNYIIKFINKYSYGIYLVHILVLFFMPRLGLDEILVNPIYAIPLKTIVCLFVSGVIVYIVNKLPYGKYISG